MNSYLKPMLNKLLSTPSSTPPEGNIQRTRVAENQRSLLPLPKSYSDQFSGKKAISRGHIYRRPSRSHLEETFYDGRKLEDYGIDEKTEYYHRDFYGRVTYRKKDVVRYISPTDSTPKRLIVQATPDAYKNQPAGNWRRIKLAGKIPIVLKLSEWALPPTDKALTFWGFVGATLRIPIVAFAIMVLLALPVDKAWDDQDFQESYTEFPNYFWDYPQYARNALDMRPLQTQEQVQARDRESDKSLSYKMRLLRPRQLVVLQEDRWVLDTDPQSQKYIFISFTGEHFRPSRLGQDLSVLSEADRSRAIRDRQNMERIAQTQAIKAGLGAYWWEPDCCEPGEGDLHNADVYRMCDVIKGAQHVCAILPDLSMESKREWGSRVWTMPEALLSRSQDIYFCSTEDTEVLTKLQMTDAVWDDGDPDAGENQPTRLLAEHYSNVLSLSRLELFTVALEALSNKKRSEFSKADIAYALMGLLNHRVQLTGRETLFQGLARLSLANDSDRLVERMVCMFPDPERRRENGREQEDIFRHSIVPDQYGTQLFDIEPLCQVVGIGEDGEVILDGCRGVSIRWKAFPQVKYKRSSGFRKLMAELVLRSGAYLSALGLALIINYGISLAQVNLSSYDYVKAVALVVFGVLSILFSFLLALIAPVAVRRLYGGRVTESAPWLVGFEGVMPINELEKTIFGNCRERLTYEPSSTPFCDREPEERLGKEPRWVKNLGSLAEADRPPPLAKGHRFFTLVDTGTLTVSIFSAIRPPSVALICGREGGLLRTVLCHYERSNNCLYKETVMRMDSMTLNQAKQLSWIKLSLGKEMPRNASTLALPKIATSNGTPKVVFEKQLPDTPMEGVMPNSM
ncbi:hypothetical protein MMC06_001442 [Schaereria dolodes]|nr:hypothetical protein [Schaereria dolodes]